MNNSDIKNKAINIGAKRRDCPLGKRVMRLTFYLIRDIIIG